MTSRDLYSLHCKGFTFEIRDGTLFVGPASRLTDEIKSLIKQHKQEIIELLKGPIDEKEAKQWLIGDTKAIMIDWPQGALIASQGTPLFTAYRQVSDAVDAAFDGTREQFLAALQRYETALMRIKEAFQKGQRICQQ
ncbi:MAG: hypothetical protein NUV45_06455 [Tepidanaerobacteraceae bacterium]|jgi:hypothetical protein|nr:hypothetical protein [Tepidanaerobacteraceae bacterium]